jgi:hypothetical protein
MAGAGRHEVVTPHGSAASQSSAVNDVPPWIPLAGLFAFWLVVILVMRRRRRGA